MHRNGGCPSTAERRWSAERYATSGQLWVDGEAAVWPGEALLERVDLLDIEPGSSRPARRVRSKGNHPPVQHAARASKVIPTPPPAKGPLPASRPAAEGRPFGCSASGRGFGLLPTLLVAVSLLALRRRSRAWRRPRRHP